MLDMATCFSEHAVKLSETTCSSSTYTNHLQKPLIITQNPNQASQNAVISMYKITLSSQKHLLVTLTWSRTQLNHQDLSIIFNQDPSTTIKLTSSSRVFRKRKGVRSLVLDSLKIDLFWDLSEATFKSGLEPTQGYYIIVTIDSQLGLLLGDLASKKAIKNPNPTTKLALISRKEHYSGNNFYSTKAQFSDSGTRHEISVQSGGEIDGVKNPGFSVSVDGKIVLRVKRLQWNFRGNHTISLDGSLFDLLWDVHGWLFGRHGNGLAVFMFRRRTGVDTRLWIEDKVDEIEDKSEFSLMIYASKTSMKEI